jgi:Family of unknown function (DUF6132)
MKTILKYKLVLVGLAFGAIGGYACYYFIGCSSGQCSITSNPVNSTLYGGAMGALLLTLFQSEDIKG